MDNVTALTYESEREMITKEDLFEWLDSIKKTETSLEKKLSIIVPCKVYRYKKSKLKERQEKTQRKILAKLHLPLMMK